MNKIDPKSSLNHLLRRFIPVRPILTTIIVATASFAIGALIGPSLLRDSSADAAMAQKQARPFPMTWRLASNFYMQTAAEYQACCLQIYKSAELRLDAILRSKKSNSPKPAVVMDLDETVLDNSTFQTFLYKFDLEYADSLWQVYEKDYYGEVALVPGAKDFIEKAESKGVTVVYVSNRSEANRQSTIKALEGLKINTNNIDERLLLKQKGESSDKSSRRKAVTDRYDVLLHIGDNLRDFSEAFAAARSQPHDEAGRSIAIERRYARVDSAASRWGWDWFILPNPVYGEWEKLLGAQPKLKLHPTNMKLLER